VKVELELDAKLETLVSKYRAKASESHRRDEIRKRAATIESSILFHIENSCDEELRKFEKSDSTKVSNAILEAKALQNEALSNAVRDNNFDKVTELVKAGYEAFLKR